MRLSFILSIAFHIAVVYFLANGFDFSKDRKIEVAPPINIEIIEIAEKNQTQKIAPPKKVKAPEKKKVQKKVEKKEVKKKPAKANASAPKPKIDETAIPLPDAKAKVKKKPKPPKKVEKKQPKPEIKKPELKETKLVKPIENELPFQSILKNLIPEETQAEKAEEKKEEAQPVTQVASLADRMTITQIDALRRQLEGCWNVPIGARDAEDLVVDVRILVDRDKTVKQAAIVDQSRYNSDSFFRAAADSALRAVLSDKCNPLILPDDKYDQWKVILFSFNPQEMF